MDVVRHQAVSQYPQPVLHALLTQQHQVRDTAPINKEHVLGVLPPLRDMCVNPGMTTRTYRGMPSEWSSGKEESINGYPRRLIAFLCVDPRYPMAEAHIDCFLERHGCKGFGEHVNGLAFDDPRNLRIYAKCNEHHLPLVFEISPDLCFDDPGLPKLENCLKQFPQVAFVGHGPAFWSAISVDDPRTGYPKGPIKPGGAVDRLMAGYANLCADLSAGSGFNAMTRDPDFTLGFIERNWKKLLWGSDIVGVHDNPPQIEWIRTVPIREEWRKAIQEDKARRVLNLPENKA